MQARKENIKNNYKTFSQQCGEQKSWTQLNVVVIMALLVHMSLLPVVADPAPTPVALLSQEVRHYGCADPIRGIVGAVNHKEVSSVYGA